MSRLPKNLPTAQDLELPMSEDPNKPPMHPTLNIPMITPRDGEDIADTFTRALDTLGFNDHSMERNRPYSGQPHTSAGIRGSTEIKGITFRDLRDAYIRAVLLATSAEVIDGVDLRSRYDEACKGERACLCENDLYGFNLDRLDPMAIVQNLSIEIEKLMGIYPNVPALTHVDDAQGATDGSDASDDSADHSR